MTKFANDFKRVSDSRTENPDIVLAQTIIDPDLVTELQASAPVEFKAPVSPSGDAPAATAAAPTDGAPAPVPGDAPAATAAAPADGAPGSSQGCSDPYAG